MEHARETSIGIIEAAQADPSELSAFFQEAFGPAMARFLIEHGDWWHGGTGGRFVAICDDVIAGYRGIIPNRCLLDGEEMPGVWGVDLFVLPRFRGLGLQRFLDQRLLDASSLIMSFPGDVGAKIYAKQGHGVREELQVLTIPLVYDPLAQTAPGLGGLAKHMVSRGWALGLRGATRQAVRRVRAFTSRAQTARYRPRLTEAVESADPEVLEKIYRRYANSNLMTTCRSADYLRWRYLEAPYRSELAFYLSGSNDNSTHYAIVRRPNSSQESRILDLFGDFADDEGLADLVRTILRDATQEGVDRVTVQASLPSLSQALQNIGFKPLHVRRFRWFSSNPEIHHRLSTVPLYWVLGDSDSDRPY